MTYYQKRRLYRRIYRIGLIIFCLVLALGAFIKPELPVVEVAELPPAQATSAADSTTDESGLADAIANAHPTCSLTTLRYLSDVVKPRTLFCAQVEVWALYIDGEMHLAVENEAIANRIIEHLTTYQGTATEVIDVALEQTVEFQKTNIPVDQFKGYADFDSVVQYVENGGIEVVTYTIVKGDTLSGIAFDNDSTVERLIADNPYLKDKKYLTIGDQLVINRPEPLVTQYVTVIESRTEVIEPSEEYVDDNALYVGEQKLVAQGTPGEKYLVEQVVYRNGRAVDRTVRSEEILLEATSDVYQRGVKPLPPQLAQSTLIRPVTAYRVTSRFGPRKHLGYHYGIDLKMPIGTPVHAAEAGTVKTAAYRGGYGNLVVISHGNGLETYYAHNSKLLVSAGQYVEKGQDISLSGNSGRSTGPHLHFEIKLNGVSVNPEKYLPF